MKKIILPLFVLYGINVFSQNDLPCGTDHVMNTLFESHPEIKAKWEQYETDSKNLTYSRSSSNYTIPLVFHILHRNGSENIADSQVVDAVKILNQNFAKLDQDTADIIPSFKSIADATGIQFELAKSDLNGNCTNGIIRYYDADTDWDLSSPTIYSYTWDPTKYLNVYVVKTIDLNNGSGVAGYTYFPGSWGTGNSQDAIVVRHNYVGTIGTSTLSHRTLTHEVGHWLNLLHVFGSTNSAGVNCNGNDLVNDTPTTKGFYSCPNANNPSTYQLCTPGIDENFQNYMDYSGCRKMFTHGQGQRMRNTLNNSISGRNNLWSISNLAVTGVSTPVVLCQADFKSNSPTSTICQADSLIFTDMSWNGNPTSWNWSFPGGTPVTSTDSMPKVQYNTPGIHNVSLTVSNSSGSVSTTKNGYVTVNPSTAVYSVPFYSEGFENAAIPNIDWQVRSSSTGSNTWAQTNAAAATGTKSACVLNSVNVKGHTYELISPTINMTALAGTGIYLKYKVAYAKNSSTSDDKLSVYVSVNCGKTWSLRAILQASAMATGGVLNSSFVPNADQWLQQNVVMSGYVNETNLMFMFRFTSGGGNNIYIDDINLSSGAISMGIEDETTNNLHFNVYPNPVEENTVVAFNLINKEKTEISICDVVGCTVTSIYNGELNTGEYEYLITEKYKLSPGIYFVKLSIGAHSYSKKLVVK